MFSCLRLSTHQSLRMKLLYCTYLPITFRAGNALFVSLFTSTNDATAHYRNSLGWSQIFGETRDLRRHEHTHSQLCKHLLYLMLGMLHAGISKMYELPYSSCLNLSNLCRGKRLEEAWTHPHHNFANIKNKLGLFSCPKARATSNLVMWLSGCLIAKPN